MRYILISFLFLLGTNLDTDSSLYSFAPITLHTQLDDMALTVETNLTGKIGMVEINNKDTQAAACRVAFHSGPEPDTIRKAHLPAGTKKLISRSFGSSLIALRINVDCKKAVL